MFNFLKSAIGLNSYLGIDIGTASIKLVEVARGQGERPSLRNYGVLESLGPLERLNEAIQTSTLRIVEKDAAALLKKLLEEVRPRSNEAVASLPAFVVFTTLLEIPQMPVGDMAKALPYQVSQHIPLPISDVAIDWLLVGEREDERGFIKQQVLVVSVPNEQVRRYQDIFKLAGLKLKALEVETMGLVRSLIVGDVTPTMIIDIGSYVTNIAIVDKGFLKYNFQTDFASSSLSQAIARGLNIEVKRAEELKRQKGLLGTGGEYELSTLTVPLLDAILNETEKARGTFEREQGIKLERVILAGGGVNLLGIEKYFEQQLNLPAVIGNPFSKVEYSSQIEPLVKSLSPSLAVAIGLGIKEFI